MEKLFISGRITRNAEIRDTKAGKVCNFSVAVNKRVVDPEKTTKEKTAYMYVPHYYEVALWRDYGESMAKWLTQGRSVCVFGDNFKQKVYIDKDGKPQPSILITNPDIEFNDGKKKEEDTPAGEPVDVEPDELPFD